MKAASVLLKALSPRFWGKPFDDLIFQPATVKPFLDMMGRPWWKRIWTIQEALLLYRSAKQVRVFLGPDELNFDVFLDAATGWAGSKDRIVLSAEQNEIAESISAISAAMGYLVALNTLHMHLGRHTYCQEIGPSLERDEQNKALHAHLSAIAGHECTNPRDAVYGLLGLFDRTPLIDSAPNYAEGLDKCFSVATRAHIVKSGGLGHLHFANSPRHPSENLPSWTLAYHRKLWYCLLSSSGKHGWAHDISWRFAQSDYYDVLPVKSYGFSRVRKVLPIARWTASGSSLLSMFKAWLKLIDDQPNSVLDFLHIIGIGESYNRPFIEGANIPKEELSDADCISKFSLAFHRDQYYRTRYTTTTPSLTPQSYAEDLERHYCQLREASLAFVILEDQRIGLAYDNVETGDTVALMLGTDMPVILRRVMKGHQFESGYKPSAKSYHFVSSCFCSRPMDKRANDLPQELERWKTTDCTETSSWRYEVDWMDCDLV